jgi:hypothetical protein
MTTKKNNPTQEWLRIAAEARPQMPAPPPDEPASAWFVTRVLAERRAARVGTSAATKVPWFALPGLARAALASTVLAVACAVFVLSTARLEDFVDDPDLPEIEEFDLP